MNFTPGQHVVDGRGTRYEIVRAGCPTMISRPCRNGDNAVTVYELVKKRGWCIRYHTTQCRNANDLKEAPE